MKELLVTFLSSAVVAFGQAPSGGTMKLNADQQEAYNNISRSLGQAYWIANKIERFAWRISDGTNTVGSISYINGLDRTIEACDKAGLPGSTKITFWNKPSYDTENDKEPVELTMTLAEVKSVLPKWKESAKGFGKITEVIGKLNYAYEHTQFQLIEMKRGGEPRPAIQMMEDALAEAIKFKVPDTVVLGYSGNEDTPYITVGEVRQRWPTWKKQLKL